MDTNRLPKQALQYKPKGRRNIGRPRKIWRDQLHLEDQGTGNTPNPSGTWWWWWWKFHLCCRLSLGNGCSIFCYTVGNIPTILWSRAWDLTKQESIIGFFSMSIVFALLTIQQQWIRTPYSMLYSFFWMIPRRLNFMCRRFGTLSAPSS